MEPQQRNIYLSKSQDDLGGIASSFLEKYPHPAIFRIFGEMGSGKTTFVNAILKKLEIPFQGSPTYSIVHEYLSATKTEILHFDLYRIQSISEALDIGFEEYLDRKAYIFIEWPEIVEDLLPAETISVHIKDSGNLREIIF